MNCVQAALNNKTELNLLNTTSSVQSVLLLIYDLKHALNLNVKPFFIEIHYFLQISLKYIMFLYSRNTIYGPHELRLCIHHPPPP